MIDGDRYYFNHVGLKSFGHGTGTFHNNSSILDLVLTKTIKDPITQRLALLEEYDKTFGLYNHDEEEDISSVLWLHPEEDPVSYGRAAIMMVEIMGCGLPELTNEPLSTLMDYPRHILEPLMERAKKAKEEQAKLLNPPKIGDDK